MRRLDAALEQPGAFGVIWGRRRVGKSRLLIEPNRIPVAGGVASQVDVGAIPGIADHDVVRALFVPANSERIGAAASVHVVDADTVMAVLR